MSNNGTPKVMGAPAAAVEVAESDARRLRVAMLGWMVAGIRTHYENVRQVAESEPGVAATPIEIHPWRPGGTIERLPLVPQRLRSTLRTIASTAPLYQSRPIDVVWSQALNPTAPFLYTVGALRRVPVVVDIDCTPRLLASFGAHYAEQVAGPTLKRWTVDAVYAAAARRCAAIVPWSEWAARSFVDDYRVPRERIQVIPPGVDLAAWSPPAGPRPSGNHVRLLFVGGDFARKGGDLLLDVWQRHFTERCELHLVTRGEVEPRPGVHVYRDFMPNDSGLRALYQRCDALVLPTRGDCFSLASIEAMVTGLPVITTAVGGIPEIVEDGVVGHLIPPDDGDALRHAIAALVEDAETRSRMGRAAREIAMTRFDASRNTRRLLDLLRDIATSGRWGRKTRRRAIDAAPVRSRA